MKEKIFEALKTEYKNLGFGQKAFDGVADYLSKTIDKEEDINNAISGVGGLLKAFQGEVDTVRNEKSGLQKELEALKSKQEHEETKEEDDVPKWAKTLFESNKSALEKLTELEAEKAKEERLSLMATKAKEYGIPESIATKLNLGEDEDIDSYMKDLSQDFVNSGFPINPPSNGDDEVKSDEDAIAELINKGTEQLKED